MPDEIWLPVPDWPYEVSDLGSVRSVERKLSDGRTAGSVVLKHTLDSKRYPAVTLRDGDRVWKVRVHRLVKLVHTGPARGRQVRHVDDVKTDTRLSHLKYGTQKQNEADKQRNRKRNRGGGKREKEEGGREQMKQKVRSRVPSVVAGCFT